MSLRTAVSDLRALRVMPRVTARLRAADWLPNLLVRVSVGFMFMSGAVGKLRDLDGFTRELDGLGIPLASMHAPVVATVELLGGLALMAGLGTRIAALVLSGVMAVALATAIVPPLLDEFPNAWDFLSNLFYAPEWLLLALLAWLVCVGSGRAGLDAYLATRRA